LDEATRIPKYFSISGSAYYFQSDLLQGRADNAGTRPMTAVNGRISIERRRTKQRVLIFFPCWKKKAPTLTLILKYWTEIGSLVRRISGSASGLS